MNKELQKYAKCDFEKDLIQVNEKYCFVKNYGKCKIS